MSSVSTISNSSCVCSLRGSSIVSAADKQTCRSKLRTSLLSFTPKFRNLGPEADLSSSGSVSVCSASLKGKFSGERCYHFGDGIGRHSAMSSGHDSCRDARQRHICARSEQLGGMAVDGSVSDDSMEKLVEVVHKLADAARVITLKYFRSKFQIIDKADLSEYSGAAFFSEGHYVKQDTEISFCLNRTLEWCAGPVTIADRSAELAMRELLAEHCPSHSM